MNISKLSAIEKTHHYEKLYFDTDSQQKKQEKVKHYNLTHNLDSKMERRHGKIRTCRMQFQTLNSERQEKQIRKESTNFG